ncbi:hypothetical protein RJP21_16845 [Paenibacillus sp. VCA1]|uniref:hypothetical protein n=1 Tax=Paenibacillus sp. VCA1 TaxID=3039148 RepID=UPI0028727A57|nr:hypothetical protein [Paenibacillus sp. VCA1]MDR9855286.1 hypothetical protein [Paenibacillus sp. VCA1]
MKLTRTKFMKAREFVYANARLLDRRRFAYHFEQGSADSVLNALRSYQNDDGGFGSALEPDIRTPYSQPVAVECALAILDEIGAADPGILRGIRKYLKDTERDGGGFPRAKIDVNEYPHAPWWNTADDSHGSLNPTGRILGLLHKLKAEPLPGEEDAWFSRSTDFVWSRIPLADPSDYHDLIQCITFLEHVPNRRRAEAELRKVDEWLQVPGTIELDPDASGYVHTVLDWAPSPESYARKWISREDIGRHLDVLIERQQEDGGWDMNFSALSGGNEAEWRGLVTVDRLVTLKAYGRLE